VTDQSRDDSRAEHLSCEPAGIMRSIAVGRPLIFEACYLRFVT